MVVMVVVVLGGVIVEGKIVPRKDIITRISEPFPKLVTTRWKCNPTDPSGKTPGAKIGDVDPCNEPVDMPVTEQYFAECDWCVRMCVCVCVRVCVCPSHVLRVRSSACAERGWRERRQRTMTGRMRRQWGAAVCGGT